MSRFSPYHDYDESSLQNLDFFQTSASQHTNDSLEAFHLWSGKSLSESTLKKFTDTMDLPGTTTDHFPSSFSLNLTNTGQGDNNIRSESPSNASASNTNNTPTNFYAALKDQQSSGVTSMESPSSTSSAGTNAPQQKQHAQGGPQNAEQQAPTINSLLNDNKQQREENLMANHRNGNVSLSVGVPSSQQQQQQQQQHHHQSPLSLMQHHRPHNGSVHVMPHMHGTVKEHDRFFMQSTAAAAAVNQQRGSPHQLNPQQMFMYSTHHQMAPGHGFPTLPSHLQQGGQQHQHMQGAGMPRESGNVGGQESSQKTNTPPKDPAAVKKKSKPKPSKSKTKSKKSGSATSTSATDGTSVTSSTTTSAQTTLPQTASDPQSAMQISQTIADSIQLLEGLNSNLTSLIQRKQNVLFSLPEHAAIYDRLLPSIVEKLMAFYEHKKDMATTKPPQNTLTGDLRHRKINKIVAHSSVYQNKDNEEYLVTRNRPINLCVHYPRNMKIDRRSIDLHVYEPITGRVNSDEITINDQYCRLEYPITVKKKKTTVKMKIKLQDHNGHHYETDFSGSVVSYCDATFRQKVNSFQNGEYERKCEDSDVK